jgi:hypothetical protein
MYGPLDGKARPFWIVSASSAGVLIGLAHFSFEDHHLGISKIGKFRSSRDKRRKLPSEQSPGSKALRVFPIASEDEIGAIANCPVDRVGYVIDDRS